MPASSIKTPRLPAYGELAYSANGSPIGAPTCARATVKRQRPQAVIEVELGDGIAVDAAALASLPEGKRIEAIEKLKDLQLQVRARPPSPVSPRAAESRGAEHPRSQRALPSPCSRGACPRLTRACCSGIRARVCAQVNTLMSQYV